MPKAKIRTQAEISTTIKQAITEWSCSHFGELSEIDALVAATGEWVTVAEVHPVANIDAEEMASFLVGRLNDSTRVL